MEIYTEGDTNTYGQLYCASGGLLDSDNNSNGNGNFKITAHLEGMKRYYIAVSHNSSTGYGDYTLRLKFLKDMLPICNAPNGSTWINDSFDFDDPEKRVEYFVYINNTDCIRWRTKLQQETFINTIKTLASQNIDDLIEELILQGFSTSFSYNIANTIVSLIEVLTPSFRLADFNSAYADYMDSGYIGFVLSRCIQLQQINGNFVPMQYYIHHNDSNYMYGYPYSRGHFEY